MRDGCIKIESNGSFWWLDTATHEYMRLPKYEAPREHAEWSDERAGGLQDAVWHPYISYEIGDGRNGPGLYITVPHDDPNKRRRVFAPIDGLI